MGSLIVLKAFILLWTVPHVLSSPFSSSDLSGRSPTGAKIVIAQMFQWSWDSIAAECENFLGQAGYGFVQGSMSSNYPLTLMADPFVLSESLARAYRWSPVVDGLPGRILYFNFQAWQSRSIPEVGLFLFFFLVGSTKFL